MMNCKRARLNIALRVGDDLDREGAAELDGHLARCADCREHLNRVESSLHPLYERNGEDPAVVQDSLWPDLLQ
ncbi:MAG: zf-HC2 domain-containing protein, partial [Planctomycetaceae bacterium]